jgi:hypothetical protein
MTRTIRILPGLFLALLLVSAAPPLSAQVRVSGQASAAWKKSDAGSSQYVFNNGRASFAWRGDLFIDMPLSEDVLFLSSFRMEQDRVLDVDLFAIRFTDVLSLPLSIEAGETDLPFGNLGERRYPKSNPFLSLPLAHEHVTSLRSSDYRLYRYDGHYQAAGNGFRLLDGGLYDLGVKLFGSVGPVDYALAVTNGMVSSTSSYGSSGLNGSKGIGTTGRVALTPVIGLTLGVSYARGPFLKDQAAYAGYPTTGGDDPMAYQQQIVGADIDFSIDHLSVYGEAFMNRWDYAADYGSSLDAVGFSLEGRYTFLPRLSAAVRVGGLRFNSIAGLPSASGAAPEPWDHDVTRVEAAVGYRLSREALLKIVYTVNRTEGLPRDPADDAFGVQTVVSF